MLRCLLLVVALVSTLRAREPETVVLLHGLGRTGWSMAPLAWSLEREGYRVVRLTYPSLTMPLETLATTWLPAQLARISPQPQSLHIVTHSMGGILVRAWLAACGTPPELGRVVMIAPPNGGSELAERLGAFAVFRWLTGPNGHRLGTGPASLPPQLGPWPGPAQLGILAGGRSNLPCGLGCLPAPHDGKVSVAATHLAGERDHRTLPLSHTLILYRRSTYRQVAAFLRDGAFAP